jgi:tetratricopeptide (TPR) repeat protein
MRKIRPCSNVTKKLLACLILATPALVMSQEGDLADKIISQEKSEDIAKIEEVVKQQREMEADNFKMSADQAYKEGDLRLAIEEYTKAIDKYKRVSSSEPRVINKLKESQQMLGLVYRTLAEKLIVKAQEDLSVELYNEADKVLLEALKFDPTMDTYVIAKRAEIAEKRLEAERVEGIDAKGYALQAAARKEEKKMAC